MLHNLIVFLCVCSSPLQSSSTLLLSYSFAFLLRSRNKHDHFIVGKKSSHSVSYTPFFSIITPTSFLFYKQKMLSRTNISLFFGRATLPLLISGKVTNFNPGKGFGFIKDSEDKDHFVHFSALKCQDGSYRGVAIGQEVEFDIVNQDGKTRAENVTAPGGALLPGIERPQNQGNFGGGGRGGGGFRGGRGYGGGRGRGGNDYNQRREAPPADDF